MHVLIDRKDSISSLLSMSMLLAYQRPMRASRNGLPGTQLTLLIHRRGDSIVHCRSS